jgi:SAM-dependent methyltransferase
VKHRVVEQIERLPKPLQPAALAVGRLAKDTTERALGSRDRLTPPARLQNVGEGDFGAVGEESLHYLKALAGLTTTDRVLDLGCGIGRTARVLARELRAPGSYDGLDVVSDSIAWCAKRYRGRTRAPFTFTCADVQNTFYNPGGAQPASSWRFPYPDGTFDLVFAISLFTHLLEHSADHYIAEARRTLAPGGRMLLTWFLLADLDTPAPAFHFRANVGVTVVSDPASPEAAVAYPETWVRERIGRHGLALREPIYYGSWRGTPSLCYQDIVVIDRD